MLRVTETAMGVFQTVTWLTFTELLEEAGAFRNQ